MRPLPSAATLPLRPQHADVRGRRRLHPRLPPRRRRHPEYTPPGREPDGVMGRTGKHARSAADAVLVGGCTLNEWSRIQSSCKIVP
uniref:Uncharacterized protein n=1 Tax=Setaria viridis TaxID=4556 RepID=A0A4U6UWJ4_SETVI|nr:hypothetical protein SEVIR_4G035301v2 [Setaria viridis]